VIRLNTDIELSFYRSDTGVELTAYLKESVLDDEGAYRLSTLGFRSLYNSFKLGMFK
jgi:hypothetical protein